METWEWFVLALTCAAGIVGLLLAASDSNGGAIYHIGLGLFVVAIVYLFVFIKRHFDRLEAMRH